MNPDKHTILAQRQHAARIFDRIHRRYDLLNHVLSCGCDFYWRARLAKIACRHSPKRVLDLTCGTGDATFAIARQCGRQTLLYGCDRSRQMLSHAQRKAAQRNSQGQCNWICGDANQLPFAANMFDIVTMAFGIRNMPDPLATLQEVARVLKPAGRIVILETALPRPPLKWLYLGYLRLVVPIVGTIISGDAAAYRYLNHTIEEFPYGQAFCRIMQAAGFANVQHTPLALGAMALYNGEKKEFLLT